MPNRSSLADYRGKRDFGRTPEPPGRSGADQQAGRAFVVQKHAARHLHFDFRLELDGALRSWAVPKGPSVDPGVQALAVHVEDHPLEYGSFEGVIPEGEYGGGTVMVWDRGEWEAESDPREGYERGKLHFRLYGRRLRGRWLLVRMGEKAGEEGKNWLLRKLEDEEARPETGHRLVDEETASVDSGRTMEEIAREAGEPEGHADPASPSGPRSEGEGRAAPPPPRGAPKRALPDRLDPQLPTLVRRAPEGDGWLHELKLDGYRILAWLEDGGVRLRTRRGHDWADRFPAVVRRLEALDLDGTILDGEIVVLRKDGTTDFQELQNLLGGKGGGRLTYFLFDLPFYRGRDLRKLPLEERRGLLRELVALFAPGGILRFSDHIRGEGPGVHERACRLALEGVVSKVARAPYEEGRGRQWVKTKCLDRQEFVVGGWTDPSGSRAHFGALLLGWYDDGRLRYAGRVGTGFDARTLEEVHRRLEERPAEESPFSNPPTGTGARGVHWVRPELVAEVEFGNWTLEGRIRHASFQGLREDKDPEEIARERPMETPRGTKDHRAANRVAGVRLTNADRVLYPDQGQTKLDLARYYEVVADWILPHVVNRPLSLVRCPRGRGEKCFYQRHLTEGMPEPVRGIPVEEKESRSLYVGIDDLTGLVTLVQFGVLEIHPWGSRADRLDRPDRLVMDLDPGEGVEWASIVDAAFELREALDGVGLTSFLRTTGGKGLHVVVPLVRRSGWDEVKGFARQVAVGFARRDPGRFVATAKKSERAGRIYVDYLRNGFGATAIASYSIRARPGAPVATPLRWDELPKLSRSDRYDVDTVPRRLASLQTDPWEGFFDLKQSITRKMLEDMRLRARAGG